MPTVTENDLVATLDQLQAQMAEISRRIQMLEKGAVAAPVQPVPVAAAPAPAPGRPSSAEEELLAISAAIGAYLGVRAHIRQIRLVSSKCMGTTGARVDPGVPQVARLVLWGSLSSCAPVRYRRFGRVANPPQAASLPHTGYLGKRHETEY